MIIALVGPSASGKTTLQRYLCNNGYSKIISYTTRDPRPGEINHSDYHFISKTEFEKMLSEERFAEWDEYSHDRFYGTTLDSYKNDGNFVCVLTPYGIRQLKKNGIDVVTVYVTANLKTRVFRYINRIDDVSIDDLQELYARSERDEGMFRGMGKEADIVIYNNRRKLASDLVKELFTKINEFQQKNINQNLISKEKEIKTIYVDFDNTFARTTECIVHLYNSDFKYYDGFKEINPKDVKTYGFKECTCATKEQIDLYFNSPRFFKVLDTMKYAKEIIWDLSKKYKIVFVSMGNKANLLLKKKYLELYFKGAEFIGVDLKDFKDKSHIDMSDGIFIDDTKAMLETSNAQRKILFNSDNDFYGWYGEKADSWETIGKMLL